MTARDHISCATASVCTTSRAGSADDIEDRERGQVDEPHPSACRCSAVDDGDHQRPSHSASRGSASGVPLQERLVERIPCGRSQPASREDGTQDAPVVERADPHRRPTDSQSQGGRSRTYC